MNEDIENNNINYFENVEEDWIIQAERILHTYRPPHPSIESWLPPASTMACLPTRPTSADPHCSQLVQHNDTTEDDLLAIDETVFYKDLKSNEAYCAKTVAKLECISKKRKETEEYEKFRRNNMAIWEKNQKKKNQKMKGRRKEKKTKNNAGASAAFQWPTSHCETGPPTTTTTQWHHNNETLQKQKKKKRRRDSKRIKKSEEKEEDVLVIQSRVEIQKLEKKDNIRKGIIQGGWVEFYDNI